MQPLYLIRTCAKECGVSRHTIHRWIEQEEAFSLDNRKIIDNYIFAITEAGLQQLKQIADMKRRKRKNNGSERTISSDGWRE